MKKTFEIIISGMSVLPFAAATRFLAVFIGREKSVKIVGPLLTQYARFALRTWSPRLRSAEDFDLFPEKMKKNMRRYWSLFYDPEITEESKDIFKLHITNCPFIERLDSLGVSELKTYFCQGDWEWANDNADVWAFERTHQIGTGDTYCNHTYKRIP